MKNVVSSVFLFKLKIVFLFAVLGISGEAHHVSTTVIILLAICTVCSLNLVESFKITAAC